MPAAAFCGQAQLQRPQVQLAVGRLLRRRRLRRGHADPPALNHRHNPAKRVGGGLLLDRGQGFVQLQGHLACEQAGGSVYSYSALLCIWRTEPTVHV